MATTPPPAPDDRPPPVFVGDHPAMDLLNTRAVPGGVDVEWLADGADLAAWLAAAGLDVPKVGAAELDAVAADVRQLRESFRRFVDRHAGRPLAATPAAFVRDLNRLLASDDGFRQVEPGGGETPLAWSRRRRPASAAAAVLLPLADAIGDLLTGADFALVRRCEGGGCTLNFLDRTKSHARRWCSMAGCGNRAKAAAHRARRGRGE